ncbi:MAG: hypothetical protein QG594_675, partial [Bacteroidota bacterium]|nr:hypothetical protein [Bacteroidota bacterium]
IRQKIQKIIFNPFMVSNVRKTEVNLDFRRTDFLTF